MKFDRKSLSDYIIPAIISVIVLFVFYPVTDGQFLNWDDQEYISGNSLVKNFKDRPAPIFSENVMGNFHPLTMLSFAIEYMAVGENPFLFHLNNILLHIVCSLLIFFIFMKLKFPLWLSTASALLFALHPMHLEAVAWISARKELLSAAFYLGGILVFLNQDEDVPIKRSKWVLIVILFLLSLLSKATAVTFPIALILLDLYRGHKLDLNKKIAYGVLLMFSLIFGMTAIGAQAESDSVHSLASYSLLERSAMSSYAAILYLVKFLIPFQLSGFHPTPGSITNAHYLSLLFWPLTIGMLWYSFKKAKWLFFGLAFFTINFILISPMVGIGKAIMAERYTYLSYTGLIFIVAYALKNIKPIQTVVTIYGLALLTFAYFTFQRTDVWKESLTFWQDVVSTYPEAFIAYNNIGESLLVYNKNDEAREMFSKAILLNPNDPYAYNNRAHIHMSNGVLDSALIDINAAIALDSSNYLYFLNRGLLYRSQGKNGHALVDLSKAIELNDESAIAFNNRGVTYSMTGKYALARKDFNKSLRLDPAYKGAYYNRGTMYYSMTQYNMAVMDFHRTIQLDPNYAPAYHNRSICSYNLGDYQGALDDALTAKALGSDVEESYIEELKEAVELYGNGLQE